MFFLFENVLDESYGFFFGIVCVNIIEDFVCGLKIFVGCGCEFFFVVGSGLCVSN